MLPQLSQEEMIRYSRHLLIPEVGLTGQRKLKDASVLLVGTGGLGSPLGLYLAAAGIGHIGIVDYDVVDCSNLQRQVIHATPDVGIPKTDSAAAAISPNASLRPMTSSTVFSFPCQTGLLYRPSNSAGRFSSSALMPSR